MNINLNIDCRAFELKAFLGLWYGLAVLLPDLMGFALRDWRAAVAGACVSAVMIALPLRVVGPMTRDAPRETPPQLTS